MTEKLKVPAPDRSSADAGTDDRPHADVMAWWNDAHPGRHIPAPTISKYNTHKKRAVRTSPKALVNPEELKRFLNLTGIPASSAGP